MSQYASMNQADQAIYASLYPEFPLGSSPIGSYPKNISVSTGYTTSHYVCFVMLALAVVVAFMAYMAHGNHFGLLAVLVSFPGIFGYIYISRCLYFLQLQESMCSTVGTIIMVAPICYSLLILLACAGTLSGY